MTKSLTKADRDALLAAQGIKDPQERRRAMEAAIFDDPTLFKQVMSTMKGSDAITLMRDIEAHEEKKNPQNGVTPHVQLIARFQNASMGDIIALGVGGIGQAPVAEARALPGEGVDGPAEGDDPSVLPAVCREDDQNQGEGGPERPG